VKKLNVSSKSDDWRARRLSNFSNDSFVLDGVKVASVEGFIQGIKFPEKSPLRKQAFQEVGIHAKLLGKQAHNKFVWWKGKKIDYGSNRHHRLIAQAMEAKFLQNKGAAMSLACTKGMVLTHEVGSESPKTSLPSKVFCKILTEIRKSL